MLDVSDQSHFLPELIYERTLSTVGSTRALFFRGGWVGSPPELVPSPGPGTGTYKQKNTFTTMKVILCIKKAGKVNYKSLLKLKNNTNTYFSVCSFWFY